MARGPRITLENGCYHITTRGNQKQKVFQDTEDYERYLGIMGKFKAKHKFKIYAFCLMPNHVHLVLQVPDRDRLPKIMKSLNLSYVIYYNAKYQKVGHLWQGRYKSRIIEKGSYLIGCINYIENNPVRAGLVSQATAYPWSSINLRNQKNSLLNNIFEV